jgi:hypothetical protein
MVKTGYRNLARMLNGPSMIMALYQRVGASAPEEVESIIDVLSDALFLADEASKIQDAKTELAMVKNAMNAIVELCEIFDRRNISPLELCAHICSFLEHRQKCLLSY